MISVNKYPNWGKCEHKICQNIRDKMRPSNISVVVRDACDIIVGQIGLGRDYGLLGTCSGHCEKDDTCWLSTALRELGEFT